MSKKDLTKFFASLDNVKTDLSCVSCKELCKNPVTLSKCLHLICGDHFEQLKCCPKCGVSLEGCRQYEEKQLVSAIESTKALDDLFKQFRPVKAQPISKSKENVAISNQVPSTSKTNSTTAETNKTLEKKTKKGETTLHLTCQVGKASQVQELLAQGAKSKTKDNTDCTSLQVHVSLLSPAPSTSKSNTTTTKINKTLEKKNKKGETSLHVACRIGKVSRVQELLAQGANPNTKDNAGWTPLHEVVQNGNLELVQLLLQYNALVNVPGQENETPLHEAIRYGHVDIIRELVAHGADINMRNIKGDKPIDLADDATKAVIETAMENIVQTQTGNLTLMSNAYNEADYEDIRVYCVSQYMTVQNKLKKLAKQHSNLNLEIKFTDKVTHLIVDTEDQICLSSLDVLQAVVNEIWILSTDWILKSTEDNLEPFEDYEVKGIGKTTHNGPKKARFNKYKQYPGLFNGCHFYFHNFNVKYEVSKNLVLSKAGLAKLVASGGGVVLRRVPNPELIPESEKLVPYHARKGGPLVDCSHFIVFKDIFEPRYNMRHLKALPVGWLIECIEKFELCDP